jgi:cation diffusion facilitator CzcD-associated flavoprotein CzcO
LLQSDILIIGGGAAGLTTAGALKQIGLESVILDKDDRIGGTWTRRHTRLHLHSVRRHSGLAHYSIPKSLPKYIPKDMFAKYLHDYARHFDLKWMGNCPVSKVRKVAGGEWTVESEQEIWRGKVVIIATGHYGSPFVPEWPGKNEFKGRLMHSIDYVTGRDFAGMRVLVVGAGNSGSEIACDLAEQGAVFVANSIRTPPPVVPRDALGTPVQVFGIAMSPLPPQVADRIGNFIARMVIGDLSRYGLKPAAWQPFTRHRIPIIDVGWVKELKQGRITIRPNVARFTPAGVVYDDVDYDDGREEAFDVVIAATGFKTGLPQLLDVQDVLDERGYPKYPSGQPTSQPGLFFMGYTESVRGHLFEANRDSRRLAPIIARYLDATKSLDADSRG